MKQNLPQIIVGALLCNVLAIGAVLIYRVSDEPLGAGIETVELTAPAPASIAGIDNPPPPPPPRLIDRRGKFDASVELDRQPRRRRSDSPTVNRGYVPPKPLTVVRQGNTVSAAPAGEGLAPSLVSFQAKNAAPEEVLNEINRQTGLRFVVNQDYGEPNWQPVTLDLQQQPVLEALMQFSAQAGVCPSDNPNYSYAVSFQGPERISLRPWSGQRMTIGIWSVSGPFLFVINRIDHTRALTTARGLMVPDYFYLDMFCTAEPKVRLLGAPQLTAEEAVDEKGNSLLVSNLFGGGPRYYNPHYGPQRVQLAYPPDAGDKIAKLRLAARAAIVKKAEPIEIKTPAQAPRLEKTIAGMRLSLGPGEASGSQVQFRLRLEQGQCNPQLWNALRNAALQLRPTVFDENGAPFRETGWGGGSYQDRVEYTYYYSPPMSYGAAGMTAPPPAKLLLELPIEVGEVVVYGEFKDLPLP